jgi:uncharacterized membrane protein YhaH (DUF805 family)
MLFSFEGRLRRRDFWLCWLGLWVVGGMIGAMTAPILYPHAEVFGPVPGYGFHYGWAYRWPMAPVLPMMFGFWRLYSLAGLLMLWPTLAIHVKRCHDRDQSGFWLLLLCIPVVNFFWWVINLGLLDGTPGPNQYGPSPKGLGGVAPATA